MEGRAKTYESTMSSDAPPSYTVSSGEVTLPNYQDAERTASSPPTYDSLFGKAKAMRSESNGTVDFVKKAVFAVFGTIGFTIFLGVMLAIPIAMIAIGATYIDDCPEEKYIPIYLIVGGSFGLVRNLFTIIRRCCCNKKDEDGEAGGPQDEDMKKKVNPFESLLDCFMMAWFIAGNVWVYRTKGDISDDPTAVNYCHPTLYWFAFWLITSAYIVAACCCCCCCFCGLFACCVAAGSAKKQ